MRRKCERIVRKFRQCPGEPRELVEESREETDETDAKSTGSAGGFEFFDRSSPSPSVMAPAEPARLHATTIDVPFLWRELHLWQGEQF